MAKNNSYESIGKQDLLASLDTLYDYVQDSKGTKFTADQSQHVTEITREIWNKFLVLQLKQALMLNDMPTLMQLIATKKININNVAQIKQIATTKQAEIEAELETLDKELTDIKHDLNEASKTKIAALKAQLQTVKDDVVKANNIEFFLTTESDNHRYLMNLLELDGDSDFDPESFDENTTFNFNREQRNAYNLYMTRIELMRQKKAIPQELANLDANSAHYDDISKLFSFNNLQNISTDELKQAIRDLIAATKKAAHSKKNTAHKEHIEALENGLFYLEETEKLLKLANAPSDTKAVYLMASVFCTATASVLVMPFAILGSTIAGQFVCGAKFLQAFRPRGNSNTASENMQLMFAVMGAIAVGVTIGTLVGLILSLPNTLKASAHYIKKAAGQDSAKKDEVLYALTKLNKTLNNQNNATFIDIAIDSVKSLYKNRAQQEIITEMQANKLDPEIIADLQLLFKLRLDEFADAISIAKSEQNYESVTELKAMLEDLHTEFKQLAKIIKDKTPDNAEVFMAIAKTLQKSTHAEKTKGKPMVGEYLRRASKLQEKNDVAERITNTFPGFSF